MFAQQQMRYSYDSTPAWLFYDEFVQSPAVILTSHTPDIDTISLGGWSSTTNCTTYLYADNGTTDYVSGSYPAAHFHTPNNPWAKFEIGFRLVAATATNYAGLLCRSQYFAPTIANRWLYWVNNSASPLLQLLENSTSRLSQAYSKDTADHTLRVEFSGDIASFYHDDVQAFSGATYTIPNTYTMCGITHGGTQGTRCNYIKLW